MYIGIDIGGTTIKAVRMENFSKPTASFLKFPTPKTQKLIRDRLVEIVEKLAEGRREKLSGIGIGIAGIVDRKKGKVIVVPNITALNGWNIADFLKKETKVSIKIDNDVHCFLRAEAKYGAALGKKNPIGIAIGTGIGGSFMIDGKIVEGATGGAAEFGHMMRGFWTRSIEGPEHKDWGEVGGKAAYEKYGDRSQIIGEGVASLVSIFDPDLVVMGGGGILSGKINMKVVRRQVKKFVLSPKAKRVPIVKTALGERAQAVGAALLFQG